MERTGGNLSGHRLTHTQGVMSVATKPCMRCLFGRAMPAVERRTFTVDDTPYSIDLCGKHVSAFDREFDSWAMLADQVLDLIPTQRPIPMALAEPIQLNEPEPATAAEPINYTARFRELQELARQQARQARMEAEAAEAAEPVQNIRPIASLRDNWRLTIHAMERSDLRGYSEEEVLEIVVNPHWTRRSSKPEHEGQNVWIHQRGDDRVVVNRDQLSVITVIDKSQPEDDPEIAALLERISG